MLNRGNHVAALTGNAADAAQEPTSTRQAVRVTLARMPQGSGAFFFSPAQQRPIQYGSADIHATAHNQPECPCTLTAPSRSKSRSPSARSNLTRSLLQTCSPKSRRDPWGDESPPRGGTPSRAPPPTQGPQCARGPTRRTRRRVCRAVLGTRRLDGPQTRRRNVVPTDVPEVPHPASLPVSTAEPNARRVVCLDFTLDESDRRWRTMSTRDRGRRHLAGHTDMMHPCQTRKGIASMSSEVDLYLRSRAHVKAASASIGLCCRCQLLKVKRLKAKTSIDDSWTRMPNRSEDHALTWTWTCEPADG